jgi:hypothetical protein
VKADGDYRLSNLCYNDVTSQMTACVDPSDAQGLEHAAQSRQFLGAVLMLGLAAAITGAGTSSPSGTRAGTDPDPSADLPRQRRLEPEAYRQQVKDCNDWGDGCGQVRSSDISQPRMDQLQEGQ